MCDPGAIITAFAAGLDRWARYRPPTPQERDTFLAGLRKHTLDGQLSTLGYQVKRGTDPQTHRGFALAVQESRGDRAWGLYLVDLSAPISLAIEVPHPANDLYTERIGVALYRRVPGALLAVAGTHRHAGDMASRTDSPFHAVAADLAGRGVPQVQLHGYRDASMPGVDVVVSPGAGEVSDPVRRAARHLSDAGFIVLRSWLDGSGRLAGRRNEQGLDAARRGTVFLHVEISRTIRDRPQRWEKLVTALAAAGLTGG